MRAPLCAHPSPYITSCLRFTRRHPLFYTLIPICRYPCRSQLFSSFTCSFFRRCFASASVMGSISAFDVPLQYPVTRRDESVVDDYHGVVVPDPYRWLEDPDSAETKDFVEQQMKLTESVLKPCEAKEKIREKLTKLFDFPKYTAPFREGNKYFYFHNTGLQPQSVLYVQDSVEGDAEVLLDPNTLSQDGTVALSGYAVTKDAKYLAYGTSSSGSDWVTIKVMQIDDKSIEPDTISWVKFSDISWTLDGKGFFYSRYPAPQGGEKLDAGTETNANLNHEIYYHFLGTDQSEDILCWSDPDNPKHTRSASVTDDGKVFVTSKDGTKIPVFIVARKGIQLDGSHPCLLYGYGGFNISITPYFAASRILLAKHLDVVFCIANIRGGGEYGEEWHKDGALAKKQNCFDDFISAAEYLVSAGYTNPRKLCIEGGSNGGLLVGACINQRPDLFGCAVAHVGVMDMLRFHKFTIGHAWTSDYGCSDNKEDFHWLIKYSPLHNVRRPWDNPSGKDTQYPSTMLLTADHDDRVVPLHSLKLLATLQHVLCTSIDNSPQTNPIIGRIEQKAGHGAGRPTQKVIDEAAERYAFMAKMVSASWVD